MSATFYVNDNPYQYRFVFAVYGIDLNKLREESYSVMSELSPEQTLEIIRDFVTASPRPTGESIVFQSMEQAQTPAMIVTRKENP